MKKIYIILSLAVAAMALLASCSKEEGGAKGFSAEPTLRINFGTYVTVPVTMDPVDAELSNLKYTSSDESVVTVDKHGTCFGVELGNATITVEGAGKTAQIAVEVYETTIGDLCQEIDGLTGLWEFPMDAPMKATVGTDLIPHFHDSEGNLGPVSDEGYTAVEGFNVHDGAILTKQSALFEFKHDTDGMTYTFLIDAKRPSETSDDHWTTFFNSTLDNSADQYIYWRKDGNFQVGGGGWRTGEGYFSNDKWFRMVVVKDGPKSILRAYANANQLGNWDTDTGAALPATWALLNADNDGDDYPLYFTTVAFWNRALSDDEVKSLESM